MSDDKKTLHELTEDELNAAIDTTTASAEPKDPNRTAPTMAGTLEQLEAEAEQRALSARLQESVKSSKAHVRVDPLIGKVVGGRFDIISKIGTGGMGTVYKAHQRGMDRFAAVKILLSQYMTNETVIARFQREALAVSKLHHPNTIGIYDVYDRDRCDDGILYIAMEYLDGSSLAHVVRSERQLPIRRALRIIRQICLSLEEAHTEGVIHRDLKPDNIFIMEDDVVKVLDFGVAKLREANEDSGTLTQHGTIFGTPKYMSPEQCRCEQVDGRSDLYSLGIMLYEMLSARVPFDSDNPLAILIMHAQESVRPLTEVRPDLVIPFDVEELLHRLLAKKPLERPESSRALLTEIDRLLNQLPEEFERVLTFEAAEEAGMDYDRSAAFTVPDAPSKIHPEHGEKFDDPRADKTIAVERLPPIRTKKRNKWIVVFATLAIVLMGTAAALYAQLQPLPDEMQQVIPGQWADLNDATPINQPKADLVTITAQSNVGGVTIVDADTGRTLPKRIEEPEQPITFQWLREQRTITLRFERPGSASVTRSVDLTRDNTLETAIFESADVASVQVVVKANVGGGLVSIVGSGRLEAMPENSETTHTIAVPKGSASTTISLAKAGYKTATASIIPTENRSLVFALETDPDATAVAATVALNLTTSVGRVEVEVVDTGALYKTPKSGSLSLVLNRSQDPIQLVLKRPGYHNETRRITPDSDQTLSVQMRKRTRPQKVTAPAPPSPIKVSPIKKPRKPKVHSIKVKRTK